MKKSRHLVTKVQPFKNKTTITTKILLLLILILMLIPVCLGLKMQAFFNQRKMRQTSPTMILDLIIK